MEFLSKEGLTHLWSKLKPKFESLNSSTTANTSEIAVQKARIDSFVSLPSGSTSGDAELMDVRVKADGTTAATAGNAVREQVGELKNLSLTSACFSEDFASFPTATDETRNGVTYTWNGYVCNVSGTATSSNSFTNFWGSTNYVPERLRGGAIIKVRTRSTDPNIYTRVLVYYPGGSFATLCPTDTDTLIFIPSDATGVLFRHFVNANTTVNGSITVSACKVISNAEYVSNQLAPIDKELSTIVVPEVLSRMWAQGNISSEIGANSSANAEYRIRLVSYIYADSRFEITVSNGLTIYVYKYSSDNYESYVGVVGLRLKDGTYTFEGGYYYKVVALFEDGRKIYPEDGSGITLTVYHPTDTTLSIAGKPADAGALGDALARVLSFKTPLLGPNDDIDTIVERGIYRWTRGGGAPQNSPTTAGGILIFVGSGGVGAQIVVTQTGYLHVRYNGSDASWCEWNSLRRDDIINEIKLSNSTSWGLSNILANANKIMSIKWTPVGNFPKTLSNSSNVDPLQFFPMTEQTGIPYSSVRDQDKAVGMDVSYRTFMTAVRDPNSVLYTRRSTVSNSASYYGTVCSGLVNVAMGLNLDLTNYYLSESDLFETVPMQSIQSGDMLWISGHCAMVKDVTKDDYGRIKTVTTMEEWRPLPRVVTYSSFESFLSYREGYIARRFKNVDGVAYEPIPYVLNFDEEESEITYPDIQTDHGDAAVFMVGEDVRINVIDQKNYSSITVERDGNTVLTRSTIVPFTIENVSSGLYTITATGDGSSSVSTFFVVDATGSFDATTGEVTYSSTNATPVMVNVYDLPTNRKITCKPIILSDEEKTAGHINVLEYMDPEYQNVKVTFMTPYGTAVWYSENHQKWLPI